MAHYSVDFELLDGHIAEGRLAALSSGERGNVEVKRGLKVFDTGNVAIERRSLSQYQETKLLESKASLLLSEKQSCRSLDPRIGHRTPGIRYLDRRGPTTTSH